MFISNFKRMLRSMPDTDYDGFMAHLANKEKVIKPAAEFLSRLTSYALEKMQAPAPMYRSNPHLLVAAFAIDRFPLETLQTPEMPLQFSLLHKAENLLESIDRVLHEHSPDEDDTAPDLIPPDTTALFLTALVEFHAAWAEFEAQYDSKPRARSGSILERMPSGSSVGPELIFGQE